MWAYASVSTVSTFEPDSISGAGGGTGIPPATIDVVDVVVVAAGTAFPGVVTLLDSSSGAVLVDDSSLSIVVVIIVLGVAVRPIEFVLTTTVVSSVRGMISTTGYLEIGASGSERDPEDLGVGALDPGPEGDLELEDGVSRCICLFSFLLDRKSVV